MDTRIQKVYLKAFDTIVRQIDKLQQIAPVKIPVIPGNHDELLSFCLGHALHCFYSRTDRVTVDFSPSHRKYELYGVVLIGLAHGKDEKINELPSLMPHEVPQLWAKSKVREWHIGHLHKEKSKRFQLESDTFQGTVVRHIGSLSGTDAWHFNHAYVGNRKVAEAFVWNHESGYVAHLASRPANLN